MEHFNRLVGYDFGDAEMRGHFTVEKVNCHGFKQHRKPREIDSYGAAGPRLRVASATSRIGST
jgi:hypothetical protein